MRAIVAIEPGGTDQLRLEDVPEPEPKPGQAIVELDASGVNFIDIYFRKGLYAAPERPIRLGMEGAGVVRRVAPDVTTCLPGDRVAYCMERGSYAEFAAVDAWKLLPLPDGVKTVDAAQIVLQGLTAHYLTRSTYPLKEGDTCLVHAAAGGTGTLIVQMAKIAGARVIGTVSNAKKAAQAEATGCDHVINYKREDFAAGVKQLTGGRGVDVVFDGVGKATFAGSLDSLRPRGVLALFGQASGPVPKIDPQILNQKGSLFLTRPSLGHHAANRDELMWRSGELFEWMRTGQVRVLSSREYPLADAAQAHEDLEKRRTVGKLALRIR
jgi:NADPH2:quinone reductase